MTTLHAKIIFLPQNTSFTRSSHCSATSRCVDTTDISARKIVLYSSAVSRQLKTLMFQDKVLEKIQKNPPYEIHLIISNSQGLIPLWAIERLFDLWADKIARIYLNGFSQLSSSRSTRNNMAEQLFICVVAAEKGKIPRKYRGSLEINLWSRPERRTMYLRVKGSPVVLLCDINNTILTIITL